MLNDNDKIRFLIALPFTMHFVKNAIKIVKPTIDTPENTITVGGDILRGVTLKQLNWNIDHKISAHIFFNGELNDQERNATFGYVSGLVEGVLSGDYDLDDEDVVKFLDIKESPTSKNGMKIRKDVMEKEYKNKGWMVAISNFIHNPKTPLELYRSKDVVEKAFYRMKNYIDLNRLRVHSDNTMQNKNFIGFIALILIALIDKLMIDNELYNKYTMLELIKTLEQVEAIYIMGDRILYPLTADQKEIFSAFGIPLPM
jgi:hypothetical protein